MFTVQENGKTYKVVFQHINSERKNNRWPKESFVIPHNDPPGEGEQVERDGTKCLIMVLNESETAKQEYDVWDTMFSGFAALTPGEQRCHETGRKKAFERAIELSGFSKDMRTALWTEYWNKISH